MKPYWSRWTLIIHRGPEVYTLLYSLTNGAALSFCLSFRLWYRSLWTGQPSTERKSWTLKEALVEEKMSKLTSKRNMIHCPKVCYSAFFSSVYRLPTCYTSFSYNTAISWQWHGELIVRRETFHIASIYRRLWGPLPFDDWNFFLNHWPPTFLIIYFWK